MNEETLRSAETAPEEEILQTEVKTEETAEPAISETVENIAELDEQELQENTDETDITHRLAEEFFLLREEFPAIHSPEQLPDAVLELAANENIPLFEAYLRFRYAEEKRIRQEEERRRQAAACAVGSLTQGAADANPEQEAFLRAFRTARK